MAPLPPVQNAEFKTQHSELSTLISPLSILHVLLVEDNPLDARLIQIMVAEAGGGHFRIDRVERLAQGLERLALSSAERRIQNSELSTLNSQLPTPSGAVDLVLLDLSLPDSHGLKTFETLHAAFPKIPIIVMSGLDDQSVAVRAVHQGAQDFLVKGQVNGPLLVRAMHYALERMRTAEQLERYAAELTRRNAQMEGDLAMAREIQQILLPQNHPTFPPEAPAEKSAIRFFHRYLPAAAVSGDFFTFFALGPGKAAILICDVMGHGMRAALVTAIMRGLIEQLRPVAHDPGTFLSQLNHSLRAILLRTDVPMLSTAIHLVLDIEQAIGHFSSAGHPSPFRIRGDTRAVQQLKAYDPKHGPALGLFQDATYPTGHFPLSINDFLILYTDGLYEVTGPDDEEYGHQRLTQAIQTRATLPPEKLFSEVLADVRQFSAGKEFEDDVCLIGAQIATLRGAT